MSKRKVTHEIKTVALSAALVASAASNAWAQDIDCDFLKNQIKENTESHVKWTIQAPNEKSFEFFQDALDVAFNKIALASHQTTVFEAFCKLETR